LKLFPAYMCGNVAFSCRIDWLLSNVLQPRYRLANCVWKSLINVWWSGSISCSECYWAKSRLSWYIYKAGEAQSWIFQERLQVLVFFCSFGGIAQKAKGQFCWNAHFFDPWNALFLREGVSSFGHCELFLAPSR